MTDRHRPHLRDAATICPAVITLSNGVVSSRCERSASHDGKHQDGCTHWGATPRQPATTERPAR